MDIRQFANYALIYKWEKAIDERIMSAKPSLADKVNFHYLNYVLALSTTGDCTQSVRTT